jgi:hypothetical protein
MMNLRAIGNYIFLGYITYNKILTREKKDLYALIIADRTLLGNTRQVC